MYIPEEEQKVCAVCKKELFLTPTPNDKYVTHRYLTKDEISEHNK